MKSNNTSECCSDHSHDQNNHHSIEYSLENHDQKMKMSVAEEQKPSNALKRFFWKINKAEIEKKMDNNTKANSRCH